MRVYPAVFLAFGLLSLVVNVAFGPLPRTLTGEYLLPDYAAHWTGGRMLLTGDLEHLYDPAAQLALQREALGASTRLSWFVSPPVAAALYAPFASLPYLASAAVWTVFSVALLVASTVLLRPMLPRLGRRGQWRVAVVAVAATQPVLECVGSGQDSAVSLFVWVCGIRLLAAGSAADTRPGSALARWGSAVARRGPVAAGWYEAAAGAVFATGLYKPQLFVIVPAVLLVLRRYRALAAWLCTAAVTAGASVALVGVGGVRRWLSVPVSGLYREQVQVGQAWKMQGLPALFTSVVPASAAEAAQVVGLVAAAAVVLGFLANVRRGPDRPAGEVWALAALTSVLACPHLVVYDLLIAVPALLYLLDRHGDRMVRLSLLLLFVVTWTVPVRHVLAGGLPWPAAVVGAAWGVLPVAALWARMLRWRATPVWSARAATADASRG